MTTTPESIFIYDAPDIMGLNIGLIAQFLSEHLPDTEIETRTDFFTFHLGRFDLPQVEVLTEEIAPRLEEREVHNLISPQWRDDLAPVKPEDRGLGVVYLAEPLQDVMLPLIPEKERGDSYLHIAYIEQCLGSFETGETELCLQIIKHGEPTIISTTGFVEAPALPREYRFRKAQLIAFGMDEATEDLDETFAEKTLAHGDTRVTHVATGFALKAIFHRLFGEDSCDDPNCPLYRARTHDELSSAHLSDEAGLCDMHTQMLIRARSNRDSRGNSKRH